MQPLIVSEETRQGVAVSSQPHFPRRRRASNRSWRDLSPRPPTRKGAVHHPRPLCTHFGETHAPDTQLLQIRQRHEAPEMLVDDCGHAKHASLHLKMTPISGSDGFEPVHAHVTPRSD